MGLRPVEAPVPGCSSHLLGDSCHRKGDSSQWERDSARFQSDSSHPKRDSSHVEGDRSQVLDDSSHQKGALSHRKRDSSHLFSALSHPKGALSPPRGDSRLPGIRHAAVLLASRYPRDVYGVRLGVLESGEGCRSVPRRAVGCYLAVSAALDDQTRSACSLSDFFGSIVPPSSFWFEPTDQSVYRSAASLR